MVLSRHLGTLKKIGQIMTSVIFGSESQSSRKVPEFPTWKSELDDLKDFSQSEIVFFRVPGCLEHTEVGDF